ncbi:Glutathione S-transferase domain [metagenome]|uniref:Glutathione S-transferase domain n=1 Tax=metagenome TaxID=256318 RepID=A0A2P2C464_9ZZZZ
MITLFDYELSADCYQVRLMLALLDLDHSRVDVEFYPSREHESAQFTRVNPFQTLPVLRDGDLTLLDVHAILVYLASRYDTARTWYPAADPVLAAQVTQWLGVGRALATSAGAARLHESLFHLTDVEHARAVAHRLLGILDEHLWFGERTGRDWLCDAAAPTVADVALLPDLALSEEGGVSRIDYPAVRRWVDRVRRLDRFIGMPGVFPVGHAH